MTDREESSSAFGNGLPGSLPLRTKDTELGESPGGVSRVPRTIRRLLVVRVCATTDSRQSVLVASLAIAGASLVVARADQEARRSGAGAKSVAGATRGGSVKSATHKAATDKASAGNATAGDTKAPKSTAKKTDSDGKKRGTAAAKRAEPKKPKAAAAVKRPASSAAIGAAPGATSREADARPAGSVRQRSRSPAACS